MGLQIPCGVYPQEATEGLVWAGPALFRGYFPCLGLAWQKDCQIIEGHVMPDHIHICIAIPPKHPVASVIGFLKGKSAIAVARQLCGRERNFTGEHLWARGYAVSTVGFELEQVRQYIRVQEEADGSKGSSEFRDKGAL